MKVSVANRLPLEWSRETVSALLREVETEIGLLAEGYLAGRYAAGTAAPTTGSWAKGDIRWNSNPSESGATGSKVIVLGWLCTVAGTPGTWEQIQILTDWAGSGV